MNPVILVPHTHWDRAWYLPFESYRHRLVRFVDKLLDTLEQDKDFSSFTLDGQTVLLDDYFEMRPENKSRLETLVRSKKIEIGPWYTLPDLFLSSGESLIRNLEMGLRHANSFGGGMRVGYVPDPFGHPAELVQILAGFEIDSFIFMRGLSIDSKNKFGSHFHWRSASGAKVLAVYQPGGYLDASALGFPEQWGRNEGYKPQLKLALERVNQALATAKKYQKENTVLLSNGCDHMPVQENLPDLIAGLRGEGLDIKIGTFAEYIAAIKAEDQSHEDFLGDLLGNADHPILSSVWSTHINLKLLNRECEKILTRYLEPLQVLLSGLGPDQKEFTESAWKKLLKNQAHDDICGCSHDEVHLEDEARFHRIKRLADGLIREKLEHYLILNQNYNQHSDHQNIDSGYLRSEVFLFNPHPFAVSQTVGLKILMPNPHGEFADSTPEKNLRAVDSLNQVIGVTVLESKAPDIRNQFLETTWGRSYTIAIDVSLKALERKILTIEEFEALPEQSSNSLKTKSDSPHHLNPATSVSGNNPAIPITFSKYGWTLKSHNNLELLSPFSGRGLIDFLSFEWEEDHGDTYSASIKPNSKVKSTFVDASPTIDGVRANFELSLACRENLNSDLSGKLLITVDFTIDGSYGLTARVSYNNKSPNGRLRMIIDPGFEAKFSVADGHFRLVTHHPTPLAENDHAPRAYPGELTYDTKHMGEFVFVEGDDKVWIGARGHAEYELTKAGLAVTLHRSVGMLSVGGGRIRGCQAGPSIPTPAAQCLGSHEHTFAIGFGDVDRLAMIRSLRLFSTPVYGIELPYLRYINNNRSAIKLEGQEPAPQKNLKDAPSQQIIVTTSGAFETASESGLESAMAKRDVFNLSHSEIVCLDQRIDLTSFRNFGSFKEIRLYNQTTETTQSLIFLKGVGKVDKVNLGHSRVLEVLNPVQGEGAATIAEQIQSLHLDADSHKAFSVSFKPSEIITLRYS